MKKLFYKLSRTDILQVLRLLQYNMGFIRIGVKVITSFCKCPNIRTTLHNTMRCTRLGIYSYWQIYLLPNRNCCLNTLPYSLAHETILCFKQEWKQAEKMFSLFYFILFYGEMLKIKGKKEKLCHLFYVFFSRTKLLCINDL